MRAWVVLVCVVTACACAPSGPLRAADFPDDPPACIGDDDCVLSSFAYSCCAPCPSRARAWSRVALSEAQARCAAVSCGSAEGVGEPWRCPPAHQRRLGVARCEKNRCVEHH